MLLIQQPALIVVLWRENLVIVSYNNCNVLPEYNINIKTNPCALQQRIAPFLYDDTTQERQGSF